jgi:peptidoglycan/xylan/chitin deacetylase (PgdA/CDA1 family)
MPSIPAKTVVLTFDDAVKSQRTFVGPFLKELGLRATFFVSHRWMDDEANFMTWDEIGELHQMGFEIGNHSWTHPGLSTPRAASRLEGELALVENSLARVKVPKPACFAWPGNGFGPEAVEVLRATGYRLARRGEMPEVEYGRATVGPLYDPSRRHPLLIPTTGDSYPNWTFEHFQNVVARALEGQAVVLQYHGVPDVAHPWVHTDPELFKKCMTYLKEQGFRTMALGDLERYVDLAHPPSDPLLSYRHPIAPAAKLLLPVEMEATRARLPYWLGVMKRHHYSDSEVAKVTGLPSSQLPQAEAVSGGILPYPGGRHPRTGFLNGAIAPSRGTKASIFLPWDRASYVVVDVPEAIFASGRLIYLAHTHIPSIWDEQNRPIDNVDWRPTADGGLESAWELPDKVAFGASIRPVTGGADMELWIRNGSPEPLSKIRSQVCVMLAKARGFDAQTNANKTLSKTSAVAAGSGRKILVEWEPVNRVWANPPCPCMHSDPGFADCPPGEVTRAKGKLRFEG